MSEELVNELVKSSDMIVNGYAFSRLGENNTRVVNLNTGGAAVLLPGGEVSETSMDDIELSIVCDYFARNAKFMETENA